ncbi:hypothetical protein OIU84_004632 [Salix udensis]|uniref:Uncharacterized protein n=1 Tax=Salix udensis TaxID=889485 RepID=A0AAD6K2M5_9ROSI|nr:hypothetical protein OIU84_004632 [Salix udensis]
MNSFKTTAHERETERFQEFLQYLSGNIDDHVESDISGGPIFGSQHHELFSSQNIELQAAVGQCDKLGAIIHSFPEYEAYKDSKESVGLLSKGYIEKSLVLQYLKFCPVMGAVIKTVIIQVSCSSASASLQASVLLRFCLAVISTKSFRVLVETLAESHWLQLLKFISDGILFFYFIILGSKFLEKIIGPARKGNA